jgi:F0F1-type ATP synthase delta subunit
MANSSIKIEANKTLDQSLIDSIISIISRKFSIDKPEYVLVINDKLIGGIIIEFDGNKIVLSNEDLVEKNITKNLIIIESSRAISDVEKSTYKKYGISKFGLSDSIDVEYIINDKLIGGIKIRYEDNELDLTIDKLLEEAFSNI